MAFRDLRRAKMEQDERLGEPDVVGNEADVVNLPPPDETVAAPSTASAPVVDEDVFPVVASEDAEHGAVATPVGPSSGGTVDPLDAELDKIVPVSERVEEAGPVSEAASFEAPASPRAPIDVDPTPVADAFDIPVVDADPSDPQLAGLAADLKSIGLDDDSILHLLRDFKQNEDGRAARVKSLSEDLAINMKQEEELSKTLAAEMAARAANGGSSGFISNLFGKLLSNDRGSSRDSATRRAMRDKRFELEKELVSENRSPDTSRFTEMLASKIKNQYASNFVQMSELNNRYTSNLDRHNTTVMNADGAESFKAAVEKASVDTGRPVAEILREVGTGTAPKDVVDAYNGMDKSKVFSDAEVVRSKNIVDSNVDEFVGLSDDMTKNLSKFADRYGDKIDMDDHTNQLRERIDEFMKKGLPLAETEEETEEKKTQLQKLAQELREMIQKIIEKLMSKFSASAKM